ncbi:MAG: hypothetical protein JO356_12095 [Acidobacteria bacterium]|nr:hypothetical protein [Acidobacteriota bacterium]
MKRSAAMPAVILALLIGGFSIGQKQNDGKQRTTKAGGQACKVPLPLILQDDNGDHLIHRSGPLGGVPFTIKVDGQFGNSEDFFVFAETLAPRQSIPFHKHHNAEELLLFEDSGAEVIVGNTLRKQQPTPSCSFLETHGFQRRT